MAGVPLEGLKFPGGASVTLVVRGDRLNWVAQPEDRGLIQLMFGRPEEE